MLRDGNKVALVATNLEFNSILTLNPHKINKKVIKTMQINDFLSFCCLRRHVNMRKWVVIESFFFSYNYFNLFLIKMYQNRHRMLVMSLPLCGSGIAA